MVQNIIKLAVYAMLIILCGVTRNTFAMQRLGNLVKQLPTKTRAPQPRPTTAPGTSFPTSQQPQIKPPAPSQSASFVSPGKNIPRGLGKPSFQPGRPPFQSISESPIPSVKSAQITFNTSPFPQGNTLLEIIKATTNVDISNPIDEKQIEENLLNAINDVQDQGFTVFLVPKNAASFLGENQLIPQEQAQWLTQEVSGKAYAGSIKLDNGNIIVLARSGIGGLYGIADPAIKTMTDYLQNFHMPETTKDLKLRKSAALLAQALTDAYEYTQKQEQEKLLSEPIGLEQPLEIPLPEIIEKPEDKEPKQEKIEPSKIITIPTKQPLEPSVDVSVQKEIKDITKAPESPADIIEPNLEAETRAKELAEEKRFQDAEKARLEKELPEIVDVEYEAFEKELAKKEEISQLEQELVATNQEIATNEQEYQETLTKIAQEPEKINADLDQELAEFEKTQGKEKEQAIAQAKAEAKRIAAVNNLDTEQQDKLFKRLENNYQEKIAQDLANKKQTIETEKNKRIETAKAEIKEAEIQKEVEDLQLKIIKEKKRLVKEKFDLEKQQIETEFNQKLQNNQNESAQKSQRNKEALEKTISFINSDAAQRELIIERLEKNALQESQEIKNALENQKNKRLVEIEQLYIQKNQELQEQLEAAEQQELQAKKDRAKEAKENAEKAAKEAQENVLKLRKEAADKKAELERSNQEADQTKNNLKKAGEDVVLAEEKQKDLEKLVEELTQQIAQEKKQLSEEEQKKLVLAQEENEKKLKAEQAQREQEVAEKEELRLKAEKAAEEARVQEQAAQEAAEKAAKDLDVAIKEQQKQEQLLKEKKEEKKRDEENNRKKAEDAKLNIEVPGGGDDQLPQDEEKEQEPIQQEEPSLPQPDEELSKEKLPKVAWQPLSGPYFQIPPLLSEEIKPAILSGQVPKTSTKQPSPLVIPAIPIEKPIIEQALPEPKPSIKIPEPPALEPIQYPIPPRIKPIEPATMPQEPRGIPDMEPLRLTPFKPRPFPELKLKTFDPYGSASRAAPAPSYDGMGSSGSSEWLTPDQPQTYLSEVKTQPAQPSETQKIKKMPRRAIEFLERLIPNKEPDRIEPQITESKGIGTWLRGLSLLQKQHAATRKKPQSEEKKTHTTAKAITNKPNRVVAFIQNITTTIKDAVVAVIDTISQFFF